MKKPHKPKSSNHIVDENNSASSIWQEYRKDFQNTSNSSLRGYGLNVYPIANRKLYLALRKIIRLPFRIIHKIDRIIYKIESILLRYILRFFSFISFKRNANAAEQFGFNDYETSIYDQNLMREFEDVYQPHGISFSHNTLKSFSYLKRLEEYLPPKQEENNLNILEIGAGVFNFGHLLSLRLRSFKYVICDLPEMISSAYFEITEKYIKYADGDYDVFLPSEIELFKQSKSKRKILFLNPDQLSQIVNLDILFDLFINHESFAEMNIETVNDYLASVEKVMRNGAIVNIVNRYSRLQTDGSDDLSEMTSFFDYNLQFCNSVVEEVDSFRQRVPKQNQNLNVFYIGEVKSGIEL